METLGQTLRRLRNTQGLGLRNTALLAGISPAYLSRIESGKTGSPNPKIISALANVLGVEPHALFHLSSSLDPEIVDLLERSPSVMELLHLIASNRLSEEGVNRIIMFARQFILTL